VLVTGAALNPIAGALPSYPTTGAQTRPQSFPLPVVLDVLAGARNMTQSIH
jgi:hypothetical protein